MGDGLCPRERGIRSFSPQTSQLRGSGAPSEIESGSTLEQEEAELGPSAKDVAGTLCPACVAFALAGGGSGGGQRAGACYRLGFPVIDGAWRG